MCGEGIFLLTVDVFRIDPPVPAKIAPLIVLVVILAWQRRTQAKNKEE
jgi:hypothetical protein